MSVPRPSPQPRAPQARTPMTGPLDAEFAAFHDDTREKYLRFTRLHLGSEQEAATERAVEGTFRRLAIIWKQARHEPNPYALGWDLLLFHIQQELARLGRPSALVESAAFVGFAQDTVRNAVNATRDSFTTLEDNLGLYYAIASLPERQFQVAVVHFVLEFTVADTARLLGCAPQTIRSTIRHARTNLRKNMKVAPQCPEHDGD